MIRMGRINDAQMIIQDGLASQPGLHEHRGGKVLDETAEHIAVRWPGSRLYHRNGGRTTWHSPRAMVYRIESQRDGTIGGKPCRILQVRHLLEWTLGRSKPGQE